MVLLWALVLLVGLIGLVVGLILMIFQRFRRKGKWTALVAIVLIPISIWQTVRLDNRDELAKTAGWTSATEQNAAREAGIADPLAWRQKVEELATQAKLKVEQEAAEKAKREALATEAKVAAENEARKKELARTELLAGPADERAFVSAVEAGRDAFRRGNTDMQKGAARPARADAICKSLPVPQATDWVGTVFEISTNSEGKGVLSLTLKNDIYVKTWSNALSDVSSGTLVEPNTAVYSQMLSLHKGDTVRFSGIFFMSSTDCFEETSMTLRGSMTEPEFLMRFSKVEKVALP